MRQGDNGQKKVLTYARPMLLATQRHAPRSVAMSATQTSQTCQSQSSHVSTSAASPPSCTHVPPRARHASHVGSSSMYARPAPRARGKKRHKAPMPGPALAELGAAGPLGTRVVDRVELRLRVDGEGGVLVSNALVLYDAARAGHPALRDTSVHPVPQSIDDQRAEPVGTTTRLAPRADVRASLFLRTRPATALEQAGRVASAVDGGPPPGGDATVSILLADGSRLRAGRAALAAHSPVLATLLGHSLLPTSAVDPAGGGGDSAANVPRWSEGAAGEVMLAEHESPPCVPTTREPPRNASFPHAGEARRALAARRERRARVDGRRSRRHRRAAAAD